MGKKHSDAKTGNHEPSDDKNNGGKKYQDKKNNGGKKHQGDKNNRGKPHPGDKNDGKHSGGNKGEKNGGHKGETKPALNGEKNGENKGGTKGGKNDGKNDSKNGGKNEIEDFCSITIHDNRPEFGKAIWDKSRAGDYGDAFLDKNDWEGWPGEMEKSIFGDTNFDCEGIESDCGPARYCSKYCLGS